jgi:hypothetical protein
MVVPVRRIEPAALYVPFVGVAPKSTTRSLIFYKVPLSQYAYFVQCLHQTPF